MKVTKRQLKKIIRESLNEKDSKAVHDAMAKIEPDVEQMTMPELELLRLQIDEMIKQLSERRIRRTK
tara:strand:- start:487 stop:687 length:201 start_codon:yes stop_codon:yes gene_type:complete